MVKADIRPWKGALGEIAYPALFLAFSSWILRGEPLWEALLGSFGFFLFIGCISRFRTFRKLRRAEQRRQSAMTVPQWIPRAVPQPAADSAALPLPFIISSRPAWSGFLISLPLVWIGILVVLTLFIWGFSDSYIPTLLLSAEISVPLSILSCLSDHKWIEAREEGLTIRALFRRRTIPWQEARLFAIDATVETNKTPDKYELASATTILRWSREQNPSRWTNLSSPFPEYEQQMDALLALIAGRTGLPLYDLRDWQLPPLPAAPGSVYPSLWRGE